MCKTDNKIASVPWKCIISISSLVCRKGTLGLLAVGLVLCVLSNTVVNRYILFEFKPSVSTFDEIIATSNYVTQQPHGQMWVAYERPLKERLLVLSRVLTEIRNRLMHEHNSALGRSSSNITWPGNSTATVVYSDENDYLSAEGGLTDQSTTAVTVFLQYIGPSLNSSDTMTTQPTNFLVGNYYAWNTLYQSSEVCQWLQDRILDNLPINPCCAPNGQINAKVTTDFTSTKLFSKHMGLYVQHKEEGGKPTTRASLTHIHVLQRGTVTSTGDIFGSTYKIAPPSCAMNGHTKAPAFDRSRFCTEVFVISQFWGAAYSHEMLENLPRLAPHLTFLRRHPSIRIHMINRNRRIDFLFKALELDSNRIVTGIVHASVIYLPRSTPCDSVLLLESQLLREEFGKFISGTSLEVHHDGENVKGASWNTVLLNDGFAHITALAESVQRIARKHGFVLKLFSDDEPPPIKEVMTLFYSARVIVSTHGEGLANMIFSRPGTHVIEGVCPPPHTSVRYLVTACRLGHVYYAIPAHQQCADGRIKPMSIDLQYVANTLDHVLTHMTLQP